MMQQQIVSLAELTLYNCSLLINPVFYLSFADLILIIHMTSILGLECLSYLRI